MTGRYALAIDQGTTNTKVAAVDEGGRIAAIASERVDLRFPQTGWAESDPMSIWKSVISAMEGCLAQLSNPDVVSVGVSNQRESVVMWERSTGQPLGPMVGWQCTRGASICEALDTPEVREMVAVKTGLGLEPMFSASKMSWLLDSIPDGIKRAQAGEICLGTVDTWLTWKLTEGRSFATDFTNASRTLLCHLAEMRWDADLLELFGVPAVALGNIEASASTHGECSGPELHAAVAGTMIGSMIGDSHSALVGHGAFRPGRMKASFGTGTSVLAPTGTVASGKGLSSTVAWSRDDGDEIEVCYAIEGNIYATGSALEWTAKLVGLGRDVGELANLAESCPDARGVTFVPAFAGLGAPHWDADARGIISGITLGANRAEVARAAFECVAHQVADVIGQVAVTLGADERLTVHADGGATRSDLLCQLVADLSDVELLRSDDAETAAVGAAHLAGLTAGVWGSLEELAAIPRNTTLVAPSMDVADRTAARQRWAAEINRARGVPVNSAEELT